MRAEMSSDANSSPESPPASHWPISLEHLLNSSTGKNLFLEYLRNEDEGLSFPLLFLLAVDGLHGVAEEGDGDQQLISSINLIYEKLLPSVSCISSEIKETIRRNLSSYSVNIYDDAVEKVRDHLSQNLYPNFLKSEFYLAAINHEYGSGDPVVAEASGGDSSTFPGESGRNIETQEAAETSASSYHPQASDLQTVHEEEVLSLKRPKPFQLTQEILLSTQLQRAKKGTGGPLNPYHAQYSSYNPVSRQDSEIQSLSSGCTDESISSSRRRPRVHRGALQVDPLPHVITHKPLPKRESYSKYTTAEQDPEAFAHELMQKLKIVEKLPLEERLKRFDYSRTKKHQQHVPDAGHVPLRQPPLSSSQLGGILKPVFGPGIDTRILQTHLKKLEESAHGGENVHLVLDEPELDGQAILDQHVRRVWKDSTTPDFSRSPRNETSDSSRKPRRAHISSAASNPTAALIKGKSMQTLDSGIGGDKEHRTHKIRPPPPVPRWSNEQFIDSGMSDAGRSSTWESDYMGRGSIERVRPALDSGPSRRLPAVPPPSSQPPIPQRRHSPPTEESVSVLVHYESEQEKPFLIKIPKSKLNLGYLKSKVPKKGAWKYLFKLGDADDRNKIINYELKRDEDVLPLFREECVFVILKSINPEMPTNVV